MSFDDNFRAPDHGGFFQGLGHIAKTIIKVPTNVVTRMPRSLLNTSRFSLKTISKVSHADFLPPVRFLVEEADQILEGADKTLGLVGLPAAERVESSDNFAGFVKQVFTGKVTTEDLDVDSPESREKLANLRKYGFVGGVIVNKLKKRKQPPLTKARTLKKPRSVDK